MNKQTNTEIKTKAKNKQTSNYLHVKGKEFSQSIIARPYTFFLVTTWRISNFGCNHCCYIWELVHVVIVKAKSYVYDFQQLLRLKLDFLLIKQLLNFFIYQGIF